MSPFLLLVLTILKVTLYLIASVLSTQRPFTMSTVTWLEKLQEQGITAFPLLYGHHAY